MAQRRNHTETGKVVEAEAATESEMDRFKSLTRRLVRVPRDELRVEQKRYETDKASKPPRTAPIKST